MLRQFTFSEKSAFIMLIALLAGGAFYGRAVWSAYQASGEIMPAIIPIIVIYVVIIVLISIIGHIAAALSDIEGAQSFDDERERHIARTASSWSGMIMGGLILMALGLYLYNPDGNLLFHSVFGAMMIAQIFEYALQIILFRRASALVQH